METKEKTELQEKIGRRLQRYKFIKSAAEDVVREFAALDKDPETVRLREAYLARKKELSKLGKQMEELNLQAKALKAEIDEMIKTLKSYEK